MNNEHARIAFEKKVNRILAIIIGLSVPSDFMLGYFEIVPGYTLLFVTMFLEILGILFIYKNYSSRIVKAIYISIISFQIVYSMLNFSNLGSLVALGGVCFVALYGDKWIVLLSSIGYLSLFVYVQFFKYTLDMKSFIFALIVALFSAVSLFFVCAWGRKLIEEAELEKVRANSLLADLQKTLDAIKTNTTDLNKDIADCNNNLQVVQESNNGITIAVQEVTQGVVGQADSTSYINNKMNDAKEKISEVLNYSKKLADVSNVSSSVVSEGYNNQPNG